MEKKQIDLGGILGPLLAHWKLSLGIYAAFIAVVAAILWTLPNVYTSQAMFYPIEQDEDNSATSLLSLAKSKAGLSMGGGAMNQVLLLKEVISTYSFADRLAAVLDPSEKGQMFRKVPDTTLRGRAEMMTWCRKNIVLNSNALSGIINLSVSSWKQEASQAIAAKVVRILNEVSATMSEDRLQKQRTFLQTSRERVKGDLDRKDRQLVELERRNRDVITPDLMNQRVKLMREQKILEETFVLLEGQILDVEIKLSRNTQTLRYLEPPTYPLVKDKPKRKLILLACLVGLAALHAAGLLVLGNLRNFTFRH